MNKYLKIIGSISTLQLLIACGASLPDQCKQLTIITKEYTEIKEPIRSKNYELSADQLFQKSKKIEKLQLSDSSLKALQQKLVRNYDVWAKSTLSGAGIAKQQELSANDGASTDNLKKQLDISHQLSENGEKIYKALQENIELTAELKKTCPNS